MKNYNEKYPHLTFKRGWEDNFKIVYNLGKAEALIKSIKHSPLIPESRQEFYSVSLLKGAQATTAIEGNTLSDDEILEISTGQSLPLSKEYQEKEVKNILDALSKIVYSVVIQSEEKLISPELIKRLHYDVGKDLGDAFQAIPGQFRKNNVFIGTYKPPDYSDVPFLIDKFCEWLKNHFHYEKEQSYAEGLIEAIVAHVYLEWIHPFSDGNGRTGRLLEFYLLLRAGTPDIASHILTSFYNETRPEYYRHLDLAAKNKTLTNFLEYALQGYVDGLEKFHNKLIQDQILTYWRKLIYDKFKDKRYANAEVFKRKRELMLSIDLYKEYELEQLSETDTKIAKMYGGLSKKTIKRDVEDLLELELLIKENNKYRANSLLLFRLIPLSKVRNITTSR